MGSAALSGRRFPWAAAALLHALCPLVFFVRKTENPYLIQILLLHVLVAAALAEYAWRALRDGNFRRIATGLDGPLALWIAASALSWAAAWLVHAGGRWTVWHQGLPGLLFLVLNAGGVFFLGAQLVEGRGGRRLRRLLLVVGAIAAGYALLQYHGVDPIWPKAVNPFSGRPVSSYGNPNFLSTALALLLPLALRAALAAPGAAGLAAAGGFFLMAGALVSTMTRSSYIGAAAGLALYLWWDRLLVWRCRRRAVLLAGVLAALVVFWPASRLDPGAPSPAARLVDLWRGILGDGVYASWHQRLLIWSAAWEMWRDNFWLGKGWGLFELFYPFYQGPYLEVELYRGFRTHANNAHHLFLELASQTGLIGTGIFLWLFAAGAALHRRAKATEERLSLAAAQAAGLAAALTDNVFGNVSLFFAVPGMLFFWTAGQWAALLSGREKTTALNPRGRAAALGLLAAAAAVAVLSIRQWQGARWFLRGSDAGADNHRRIEAFEKSRRWHRADVGTLFQLGRAYISQARWAQENGLTQEAARNRALARGALDAAVEANPGYSEIYFNRAALAAADGRPADAARDYRLGLVIDPLAEDGRRSLQALYENAVRNAARAADWPAARGAAERLVALVPENTLAHLMLGDVAGQAGDRAAAAREYLWILEREPGHAEARRGLAALDLP